MGIIFWYVVPFLITLLLMPKYLVAHNEYTGPDFSRPILIRHFLLSLFVGLFMFVNLFSSLILIVWYTSHYRLLFKGSYLDKPLFPIFKSKKVIEK